MSSKETMHIAFPNGGILPAGIAGAKELPVGPHEAVRVLKAYGASLVEDRFAYEVDPAAAKAARSARQSESDVNSARDAALKKSETEIVAREAAVKTAEAELVNREAAIAKAETDIAAREAAVKAAEAALVDRETAIVKAETDIATREAVVTKAEAELAKPDKSLFGSKD